MPACILSFSRPSVSFTFSLCRTARSAGAPFALLPCPARSSSELSFVLRLCPPRSGEYHHDRCGCTSSGDNIADASSYLRDVGLLHTEQIAHRGQNWYICEIWSHDFICLSSSHDRKLVLWPFSSSSNKIYSALYI